MHIFLSIYLFVIGLAFGSFSLVLADRTKSGEDWVISRSKCDSCGVKLHPKQLIPVVSWVLQRGKCSSCSKKISFYYPLAELGLGLGFVVSFLFWPRSFDSKLVVLEFIVWLLALTMMMSLLIYDLKWFLLPSRLIYFTAFLALIFAGIEISLSGINMGKIIELVLSVLVGSGVFALLYFVSKGKWIGDGDVRFGLVIGLFTGSPWASWFTIFLASVLGMLFSLPMIIKTKKNSMKLKMPFGPVLIISLWLVVLFGARIISWYKTNFLFL